MRECHRLGTLQVGIARHHRVLIILRGFYQRRLQLAVSRQQLANGILAPQFQVSRDLVITATPGMQLFA